MSTLLGRLRPRRPVPVDNTPQLIAEAVELLEHVKADNESAFAKLDEVVPGYQTATWAALLQNRGYAEEYHEAVTGYKTRRYCEDGGAKLSAVMPDWRNPASLPAKQFEAGVAAMRVWEKLYILPPAYRTSLAAKYGDSPTKTKLQAVLDEYVEQLTSTAWTADDQTAAAAFAELRQLRNRVDSHHPDPQLSNHCWGLGLVWPAILDWKDLVCRHLDAPTVWDLGLPPKTDENEFPYRVAQALHAGSQAYAMSLQAYLNASAELRELVPDLMKTALLHFAATGERLPIDRWLQVSTEPAS